MTNTDDSAVNRTQLGLSWTYRGITLCWEQIEGTCSAVCPRTVRPTLKYTQCVPGWINHRSLSGHIRRSWMSSPKHKQVHYPGRLWSPGLRGHVSYTLNVKEKVHQSKCPFEALWKAWCYANSNLTHPTSKGGPGRGVTLSPGVEVHSGDPRGSDHSSCINLGLSPCLEKRGLMGKSVPPHQYLSVLP